MGSCRTSVGRVSNNLFDTKTSITMRDSRGNVRTVEHVARSPIRERQANRATCSTVPKKPPKPQQTRGKYCRTSVSDKRATDVRQRLDRATKAKVWAKTDGNCWYCGTATNPFRNFEVDHFIPIARGGTDEDNNLVPACSRCNGRKGDRDAESIRRGQHPFYGEMHQEVSDE